MHLRGGGVRDASSKNREEGKLVALVKATNVGSGDMYGHSRVVGGSCTSRLEENGPYAYSSGDLERVRSERG